MTIYFALINLNLYRINGPAGTKLPEEIIESYHCGTSSTGWLNGTHPTVFNEIVDRNVCFQSIYGDPCLYQSPVQILNCGEFYLYHLENTPACRLRYCTK